MLSSTGAEAGRAEAGQVVGGRYRLLERIGSGGMGTVWLAEDPLLGRRVALKKMHVPLEETGDAQSTPYERTRREARSVARISHPNVVVVHDVVEHEGLPCIVMEHVPSRTLDDVVRQDGPVAPGEAVRIGCGMIGALRAAHAAEVLHRDVKPGNVLLGANGRMVLTDFGIAVASGTSSLTRTGEVIGSVDYLAPELFRGGRPSPACDLWALGATLYAAVEGHPPFRRDTAIETAYAITVDPPHPPARATVLTPLIEQLLRKDPADRPSAEDVEVQLRDMTVQAGAAGGPVPATVPEGPSAPGSGPPPPGSGRQRRSGRRRAVGVAVAVLAAAAATGGVLAALHLGDSGDPEPPGDKPSRQSTAPVSPPLPGNYHFEERKDLGLSVPVPDGWRRTDTTGNDLTYVDPAGLVSLRIDVSGLGASDQLQRWKDDRDTSISEGKLPGYSELRMQRTTYRDMPAAVWEFTFQGRAREFRAVNLGFGEPGRKEYALYLSGPSADWNRHQKVFDRVREHIRIDAAG